MKLITIRTFAALAALPLALAAGESKTITPKAEAPPNPLSFFDGALVFDFEDRVRFEGSSNTRDFDDSINDDQDDIWASNRFRFGLAIKPARWLKLYAQLQDTREWDSDRPNTPGLRGAQGDDNFDLRQGYLELADFKSFPIGVTVGRQRLNYGERRLIGDPNWNQLGRTFDAVKLRWQSEKFAADLFAARPVQFKDEVFNDSDAADNVFGLYTTNRFVPWQETDLYWIYRDKGDAQPDLDPTNRVDPRGAWNGPAQRIHTVGTRWKSKPGALRGWDYLLEAAIQWGDVWESDRSAAALEHRAGALSVAAGYTFEQVKWKPRLALEYNFATGDENPADGESQSFQNLFPGNHVLYGHMDVFGWRNLHNLRAQVNVKPLKTLDIELSYHAFWLDETTDYGFRNNGFSTLRTRTPDGRDVRTIGAGKFAGHEVDLFVKWNVTKNLNVDFGYNHFFAADYLRDTGPSDDADFAYVQAQILF
jgi:hypothetical protein